MRGKTEYIIVDWYEGYQVVGKYFDYNEAVKAARYYEQEECDGSCVEIIRKEIGGRKKSA